ncbi:uncharacterized protein EV422DRAFT_523613 [Fimicolochytrium jonesii]|uniref:uncharacterized protein n=1 Tax=Fimicolochytrium jonesii TaxID=1396493 RepID=UPI0022FE963C|nr:uncharacterized protein EV422DRAFT_523613 [Fimicolochytrium jonesii]KAI8823171.1 hypothetical protein EV422DRAFT_523613 [Fimicolochytrium jonesii]
MADPAVMADLMMQSLSPELTQPLVKLLRSLQELRRCFCLTSRPFPRSAKRCVDEYTVCCAGRIEGSLRESTESAESYNPSFVRQVFSDDGIRRALQNHGEPNKSSPINVGSPLRGDRPLHDHILIQLKSILQASRCCAITPVKLVAGTSTVTSVAATRYMATGMPPNLVRSDSRGWALVSIPWTDHSEALDSGISAQHLTAADGSLPRSLSALPCTLPACGGLPDQHRHSGPHNGDTPCRGYCYFCIDEN